MKISGFGTLNCPMGYKIKTTKSNIFEKNYLSQEKSDTESNENAGKKLSLTDIYHMMSQGSVNIIKEDECESNFSQSEDETAGAENDIAKAEEDEKTNSEIVVKPDGSRVLVITTSIGGMKTTMSLEISKPVNDLNDSAKGWINPKDYTDVVRFEDFTNIT